MLKLCDLCDRRYPRIRSHGGKHPASLLELRGVNAGKRAGVTEAYIPQDLLALGAGPATRCGLNRSWRGRYCPREAPFHGLQRKQCKGTLLRIAEDDVHYVVVLLRQEDAKVRKRSNSV